MNKQMHNFAKHSCPPSHGDALVNCRDTEGKKELQRSQYILQKINLISTQRKSIVLSPLEERIATLKSL
jgi:hypothetical protein